MRERSLKHSPLRRLKVFSRPDLHIFRVRGGTRAPRSLWGGGVVAALISLLLCTLNVPGCYLDFNICPCSIGFRLHMHVFNCLLIYSFIEVKDNKLPAGWGGIDTRAVRDVDVEVIPSVPKSAAVHLPITHLCLCKLYT